MDNTLDDRLPLNADEDMQASFGERRGLDPSSTGDRNSVAITERMLLRVRRRGRRRDVTLASLTDVGLVEVRRTTRGVAPLGRVILLLGGAGAALATIGYPPLEMGLAGVLALAALYHLLRYLSVSEEGVILFHVGREQMWMSYRGELAEQAIAFADALFRLKQALLPSGDLPGAAPQAWDPPGEWESHWRW